MEKFFFSFFLFIYSVACCAEKFKSEIKLLFNEKCYGAYIAGTFCSIPLKDLTFEHYLPTEKRKDLILNNRGNQVVPLLIFNMGRNVDADTVQSLDNGKITVQLAINKLGIPYIQKVTDNETSIEYFGDLSTGLALQHRLENSFMNKKTVFKPLSGWKISEDSIYIKAQATVGINQCKLTMHIELMKGTALINVYNTISADQPTDIKEFPVLSASFILPDSIQNLQWWKALDYTPQNEIISNSTRLLLNSRIHSSDNYNNVDGNVPYWTISTPNSFIGFSLAWCGGWRAGLNGDRKKLDFDVYLPQNETHLKLNPGEEIKGPELSVFCSPKLEPMLSQKNWKSARSLLAQKLYPTPQIGFPLIYNHWYAVGPDLSERFVNNQVRWFNEYGFDVFMIDDGWYKKMGSWTPSDTKFKANEFNKAIESIRSGGAIAGLWSSPQLTAVNKPLPNYIDSPGFYSPFMKAWLIDYSSIDFNRFMVKHIDTLSNKLGAGWWKFDQDFFAVNSRSGKMRNVIALQNAFASVRKTYPNLIIEACMGGGKMINEFTDRISQIHWIRDGERTGYLHAITNIYEALGAVEFLEPQKVQRWTNRINETDIKTTDLLKFYCRSSMIGTWGISDDLNKISTEQKSVILKEVANYRRLNEIKKDGLIEFSYPTEYTNLVPVVFYNETYTKAAIILYRMFPKNQAATMKLKTKLMSGKGFEFNDVDAQTTTTVNGNVFNLKLLPSQNSAIFFVSIK